MNGWKRAPARIVERSHADCRKPVRCCFRFNRGTGNQDRHCSVCVGRGALPFNPAGYLDKASCLALGPLSAIPGCERSTAAIKAVHLRALRRLLL